VPGRIPATSSRGIYQPARNPQPEATRARSSQTPRCQDPSVRRQFVDSPIAGALGRAAVRGRRISRCIGGRPTGRAHVHRWATNRRCQRSSVAGVTMKAGQRTRGRSRLATVSNARSTAVIAGRRRRRIASSCPQDDNFEFLELLRPNAQHHQLENPANQPVAQRHEHGASSIARLRPNSTHKPPRIRVRRAPGRGSDFMHPSPFGILICTSALVFQATNSLHLVWRLADSR
jgi:hypothetical protein